MPTEKMINDLVINKMTKAKYQELQSQSLIQNDELYFITDDDSKQDKLIGTPDQLVGFDENGNAVAVNAFIPPTPSAEDKNKILSSNNTWVDGASLISPKKITLVATSDQTVFTIPFEYDSLSSNLTVYFNGILMKETDNYTVDTANNTVNLAGFSAEDGDIITIMGLLGAQSIDFGQEAIDAINEINAAIERAKQEIDNKVQNASDTIDTKVEDSLDTIDVKVGDATNTINVLIQKLPESWDDYLIKGGNNQMISGGKITMASDYVPSADDEVTTKKYVDSQISNNLANYSTTTEMNNKFANYSTTTQMNSAISAATASIVTDIYKTGSSAPSNTKLLWIDTGTSDPGLKYHNGSSWVTVPVRWS